ncbi:MAG: hypothetical protein KGM98_03775 [Bacteroidota bacterium]|nr:hypothetical protein [Bacteroidota bacterium]
MKARNYQEYLDGNALRDASAYGVNGYGGGGGTGGHYSYMDQNGNFWMHSDPLAGTISRGIQYQSGFGIDGFGGLTYFGGEMGYKNGFNNGISGKWVSWAEPGTQGDGRNQLAEVKVEREFISSAFGQGNFFSENYYFTDFDFGYPPGLRQYIAIAVGEAAGNGPAAKGIGSTLINRMILGKTNLYDPNWLVKSILHLGGTVKGNYQIMAHPNEDYNDIMHKMTMNQIIYSSNPGIQGALEAYNNWGIKDFSNGAYYWNATSQKYSANIGINFRNAESGTYIITAVLGNTTFFTSSHH